MLVRVTATKVITFLLADILFKAWFKENCERADDDLFIFVVELMAQTCQPLKGDWDET